MGAIPRSDGSRKSVTVVRGKCPKCGTTLTVNIDDTKKQDVKRWPAAFDRAFALADRVFKEMREGFKEIDPRG
jgi:hypothetical protein